MAPLSVHFRTDVPGTLGRPFIVFPTPGVV